MKQFASVRCVTFVFSLIAALILFPVASHAQRYTTIDLGTLGGRFSAGSDINSAGQVTGYSTTTFSDPNDYPFLYESGALQRLGMTPGEAYGINSKGEIVGALSVLESTDHAFLYSGGAMQDLGTLGGDQSVANDINDNGQITGYSEIVAGNSASRAFLYANGTMKNLGTLGGANSNGWAINAAGQVVGYSDIDFADTPVQHAFLYRGNSLKDLGTLGGDYSIAFGINNAGQVTGFASTTGNGPTHAFLYANGAMSDLGTLGGDYAYGASINSSGIIVGGSKLSDSGGTAAFIYRGVMTDLNTLNDTPGWELAEASAINDAGQIVGTGFINGKQHAFLLTPTTDGNVYFDAEGDTVGGVSGSAYIGQNNAAPFASFADGLTNVGVGVNVYNNATFTMSGGVIGTDLSAFDNSIVNITGGKIHANVWAYDNALVTISGGVIGDPLFVQDNGRISLIGRNLTGVLADADAGLYSLYFVSGTLADGTALNNLSVYVRNGSNGTFNLTGSAAAPEPGTLVLAVLGLLPLIGGWARRRTERKAAVCNFDDQK